VNRRQLKLILFGWSFLAIADVWFDRWSVKFIFGSMTCLLGAVTLTAGSVSTGAERKESRNAGLLLLILGAFLSLMEAYDRFIIQYH
jgi:hypothetical protein